VTSGATHRVLIVEDDPEIRYFLSVVLDEDDREILTATTGEEATAALEGDVDLVVLDLILPDIDGRTLLSELRSRPETQGLPVVIVSARGGPEVRHDCYELGADLFVEKPFDPEEVVADVAARLGRVEAPDRDAAEDSVTGLLSRAGLAEAVPGGDTGYAAAIIQLDGFLTLTERWGWSEGERLLGEMAACLGRTVGARAPLARLGGGEFAVLLPETSLEDPMDLATRILEEVRAAPATDSDGEPVRFTASIGLVEVGPGTPLGDALDVARSRLFRARDAGGNRVLAEDVEDDATTRILVAEDDEISATILMHRLKKEGHEIVRFDNGRDAYEAAMERAPNLVILDVKMPGMDGFEVLERLRRSPAYLSVPIILLTSMGSEADVVRGFQLGADDYILKPFSPVELSARVWRLLRRGRSASAV